METSGGSASARSEHDGFAIMVTGPSCGVAYVEEQHRLFDRLKDKLLRLRRNRANTHPAHSSK